MKLLLPLLLLISSTLTAQVTPAQFRKSMDSVAALSRSADNAQNARIAALETETRLLRRENDSLKARTIQLTTGAADTLRNISTHLTANRNRIEAVNLNWWRADQALIGRIDSGVVAQRIVNTATTSQISGLQLNNNSLSNNILSTVSEMEIVKKQQAAQQAILSKVEAWIKGY